VTEFGARTTLYNRVIPCVEWNKEFLARRVFYLFNCCTNVRTSGTYLAPSPALDLVGGTQRTEDREWKTEDGLGTGN
jgi:hypothetical protein